MHLSRHWHIRRAAPACQLISVQGMRQLRHLLRSGYGNAEALRAVKIIENIEEKDTETILKEALKRLI